MYRIATAHGATGPTRQSEWVRRSLASSYLMFMLAGILLALGTEPRHLVWEVAAFAAFLSLGGLLAAIGTFRQRWSGEFTGLPLLASALLAIAVTLLRWTEMPGLLVAAHTTMILAVVGLLGARWRVALAAYRLAHHVSRLDIERGA